VRYRFFLVAMAILFANAAGCSYLQSSPPNGKVSVQAVSWKLVKKLAEPNAGLSGQHGCYRVRFTTGNLHFDRRER
jgi:hypothetical protein